MTITRDWLQQKIAAMEETRDEIPFGLDEDEHNTLEALRIALASLEAEAVHQVFDESGGWFDVDSGDVAGEIEDRNIVRVLFTAPPAPASVPADVMAAMQKVARIRLDLNDFDGDKRGIVDCLSDAEEALIEVVNRRAAMLKGGKS